MDAHRHSTGIPGLWKTVATAALCGLLALSPGRIGPAAEPDRSKDNAAAPAAAAMSLADCLDLALQKQPAIHAAHSSLTVAEAGQRALDCLHFPASLAAEVPFRRLQAAEGVTAANAGILHAERETIYAVTRTWFTVVYARQQEKVARRVVDRLKTTHDLAAQQLKDGAPGVTSNDVDRSQVYLDLAETKRIQASEGAERSLAALREAIGLDLECSLQVPDVDLPEPDAKPCLEALLAEALGRRPALIEARAFAEAANLEVAAQKTSCLQRMETFASGADIHVRPALPTVRNGEYKPGSLAPEMPVMLVGCQEERICRASALAERAGVVFEKTRQLVILDVEDAFHRWQEAQQKAERAKRALKVGDQLAANLNQDFAAGQKVKVEEVINAHVLASQARSQYNEFLYNEILALADLERSTAGGFCAGLVKPAAAGR